MDNLILNFITPRTEMERLKAGVDHLFANMDDAIYRKILNAYSEMMKTMVATANDTVGEGANWLVKRMADGTSSKINKKIDKIVNKFLLNLSVDDVKQLYLEEVPSILMNAVQWQLIAQAEAGEKLFTARFELPIAEGQTNFQVAIPSFYSTENKTLGIVPTGWMKQGLERNLINAVPFMDASKEATFHYVNELIHRTEAAVATAMDTGMRHTWLTNLRVPYADALGQIQRQVIAAQGGLQNVRHAYGSDVQANFEQLNTRTGQLIDQITADIRRLRS